MQIYADVTNMEIRISGSTQTAALGAAISGAAAAGSERGGYDSLFDASRKMANVNETVYRPIRENVEIYQEMFVDYNLLHDYFGRGMNNVMKRLKKRRLNGG